MGTLVLAAAGGQGPYRRIKVELLPARPRRLISAAAGQDHQPDTGSIGWMHRVAGAPQEADFLIGQHAISGTRRAWLRHRHQRRGHDEVIFDTPSEEPTEGDIPP